VSSLQRWSEEGATTDELSLLELSRRERAPAQARTRALKALGIGVVATSTTTTAVAAAGKGGVSALLKLAALSAIGVGVAAGGVVLHSAHERGQEAKASHARSPASCLGQRGGGGGGSSRVRFEQHRTGSCQLSASRGSFGCVSRNVVSGGNGARACPPSAGRTQTQRRAASARTLSNAISGRRAGIGGHRPARASYARKRGSQWRSSAR